MVLSLMNKIYRILFYKASKIFYFILWGLILIFERS